MDQITHLLKQHLHDIATSIVATLLVIFGNDINRFIKGIVSKNHFAVRLSVFVLVCAMGYGVATLYLVDVLLTMFSSIPKQFLAISILITFILLGHIAQSRNHI